MSFTPLSPDHAVELCEFAVGLVAPIGPATIALIQAQHEQWEDLLPAMAASDGAQMEPLVPLVAAPIPVSITLANLRPNGSAVWAARCAHNEFAVACTRYTRWAPTWETARDVVRKLLNVTSEAEVARGHQINSISLRVTDRFYNDDLKYQLDSLFKRGSELPERVFGAGPIWHSNTGWFEPHKGNEILSLLNIDARREDRKDGSRIAIGVVHHLQLRLAVPVPISAPDKVEALMSSEMAHLHQRNKQMMAAVLQEEMVKRINLSVGAT